MGTGRSWTGRGTALLPIPSSSQLPCPISANTATPTRLSPISSPLSSSYHHHHHTITISATISMDVQCHIQPQQVLYIFDEVGMSSLFLVLGSNPALVQEIINSHLDQRRSLLISLAIPGPSSAPCQPDNFLNYKADPGAPLSYQPKGKVHIP